MDLVIDQYPILLLIAGLVFFLFGMNTMSANLEKMAGGKLENTLKKVTSKPILGLTLGTLITMVIQSSSATTVILVGLVNSGLMLFPQTLPVIFGANIGTTITAWLLSMSVIDSSNVFVAMLKPINFCPILALIGTAAIMLSKKERSKSIGTIAIGFALLMYGMELMSIAVDPLTKLDGFATVVEQLNSHPLLSLVVAMVFTAIVQSSSAATGILQALSITGIVNFGAAIPMILGINIGTCITAVIACIGTNVNARRVAATHLSTKVIGAVVFLPLYLILNGIFNWAFVDTAINPVWIAVVHSVYNIGLTMLLMPFSKLIVKLITFLIRDKKEKKKEKSERIPLFMLDEHLLRSPSIAISECSEQTVRMCTTAHQTLKNTFAVLYQYNSEAADEILAQEDWLDKMEDRLGTYLVPIGAQSLSSEDSRRVASMLHNIGDFERLGDHAVNLLKVSKEMHDKSIAFSEQAKGELEVLMNATSEILDMTERAFREKDSALAARVEPLEQVIDQLISRIKANHIDRLCAGDCTIELGFVLSDLLTNFERISDHCSNIAVAMIELRHGSFDTHRYLNDVKTGNNEEFKRLYASYSEQFAL